MADLGKSVSVVYDAEGYNYDMVVFQKGKPPLDSEMNLSQELQNIIASKNLKSLPSGWISLAPFYADKSFKDIIGQNKFYSQNPADAKPEYALVNGQVIRVTNTGMDLNGDYIDNVNIIDLGVPPTASNRVTGVFLETWRALLDPDTNYTNDVSVKPGPASIIDTFNSIHMYSENVGWICGDNGVIYVTADGGNDWVSIDSGTKRQLKGIHFYNDSIGWAVGESGALIRSSNGGQSWNALEEATIVTLNSVHAGSSSNVWAVGNSGTMLKSINGVTFVPFASNVTYNLNKVFFADESHGWVVGDGGNILMTSNGGTTWSVSPSGVTEDLNSVYFYNENFGFAVGDNGTILESTNGGGTWVSRGGSITTDLYDVTMVPKVDEEITGEEVSSQLGSTGTTFIVQHKPITGQDRKGVVTNSASDVTVTVDGVEVLVDYIDGTSGTVLLAAPPGPGKVTKIDYFYKSECAVFQGNSWVVGDSGTILKTENLGSTWSALVSGTGFDLRAVDFVSQNEGWTVGAQSAVRTTQDGGTSWLGQLTDIAARSVQQVYLEGNNGGLSGINSSSPYLADNMIHPDAQIETTKRVQVQYKIRVLEAIDPVANSEVINTTVLGEGPNTSGSFYYENMGPINGDYGCWRAKCLNTVDGYVYAIPMFMANRRNTNILGYDKDTNPNGQHTSSTIRPDLLTAYNVVPSDILDVRHKVILPSVEEMFSQTFDALSANTLRTNLGRSDVATFYGTELLQTDTFTGAGPLVDAVNGNISSDSSVQTVYTTKVATDIGFQDFTPPQKGVFHPDPARYKGVYSISGGEPDGKAIPGQFYGFGTQSDSSFVFNTNAKMSTEVSDYNFYTDFISDSTQSLTKVPLTPQLVKNSNGVESHYYQGVMDSTNRLLESWESDTAGYTNYSKVYSAEDITDTDQLNRASNVELHYFIKATTSGSTPTLSSGNLVIPRAVIAGDASSSYDIFTVKHIYNRTANPGILHRISDISFSSDYITITPVSGGYEFFEGIVYEVVAAVTSGQSSTNTRNGSSANFNSALKSVGDFIQSKKYVVESSGGFWSVTSTEGDIMGWSTIDTETSLSQAVCWVGIETDNIITSTMREVSITRISSTELLMETASLDFVEYATIQLLIKKDPLDYPDEGDTLDVSYYYNASQCQSLPSSLTVDFLSNPTDMFISNVGTGGGASESSPYTIPLNHLPVNNSSITNDNIFNNYVKLKMANYFVDSGFLKLPINVGNVSGMGITFSNPQTDAINRAYYSECSEEFKFSAEGLQLAVARKAYVPVLARVRDNANSYFMKDEYVLVIFSRPILTEKENMTGYFSGGHCSISVYRLPNKPLGRE